MTTIAERLTDIASDPLPRMTARQLSALLKAAADHVDGDVK